MPDTGKPLINTPFEKVPVGAFFKETQHGVWLLKTSLNTGLYRADGIEAEPRFSLTESVMIEPQQ